MKPLATFGHIVKNDDEFTKSMLLVSMKQLLKRCLDHLDRFEGSRRELAEDIRNVLAILDPLEEPEDNG